MVCLSGEEIEELPKLALADGLSVDPLRAVDNVAIESVEAQLLALPQVELPLNHQFAPGVYLREIFMPAGTFVIGHEHTTEHFNIVTAGRALVMIAGEPFEITAPATFVSKAGVRKVLYILEDMRWMTVHPSHETDIEKLEGELIVKSPSFTLYHEDMKKLQFVANLPQFSAHE